MHCKAVVFTSSEQQRLNYPSGLPAAFINPEDLDRGWMQAKLASPKASAEMRDEFVKAEPSGGSADANFVDHSLDSLDDAAGRRELQGAQSFCIGLVHVL